MEKEQVDKDGFYEGKRIIRQINSYPSSSNTVRLRLWSNQKVQVIEKDHHSVEVQNPHSLSQVRKAWDPVQPKRFCYFIIEAKNK